MSELTKKPRPQFRNIHITQLMQYRLPAAGIMSILHRVSGAILFFGLPIILWLFSMSLTSELSYAQLVEFSDSFFVKIVLCGLIWAFFHHLFAGIRHLVCDMHMGLSKEQGSLWSSVVMGAAVLLSLVVWLKIFGVY
jgi:succinate dehydrogenase / fumarate reductase, cytochrome b subunit